MITKNDHSDKKAGSFWLAFLFIFCGLALAFPGNSEAKLPPYVKSIEYVEISLSTAGPTSANLSKSQTIASCVPFVTKMATGHDDDFRDTHPDIYFESGPKVTASRTTSDGTLSLGIFVIEFDSSKVRVQQNSFSISSSSSSGTASLGNSVTQSKTALIFYYQNAPSDQDDFHESAVAGYFSLDNQLTFARNGTDGTISGHYFVFEALNNEFSVQAKSFSIAGDSTSGNVSISSVAMDKTFLIASYLSSYSSDNPRTFDVNVYLNSQTQINAERNYDSSSGIEDIRVFAITFSGDELVQRGSFSYAASDGQEEYSLSSRVNPDEAIAWNGVAMPGPGAMMNASGSGTGFEDGYQRLKIVNSGATVQGDRAESAAAATGRWEVIWFRTGEFNYRKQINLDYTKVSTSCSANLTNFPVLISITNDPNLRTRANDPTNGRVENSNGWDIIFRASDGITGLPHEVVKYDGGASAGTILAWVKIPTLKYNENTSIYIYYGNPLISAKTETPTEVWDSSVYKGVWHLEESSGNALDSTSYGSNGSISGTVTRPSTTDPPLPLESAYDFGTDGQVAIADPPDGHLDFGTDSFTVSFWLNVDASTGTTQVPIHKGGRSTTYPGYDFETGSDGQAIMFEISTSSTKVGTEFAALTYDTWTYIAGVVDRANQKIRIYKNGVQQGTGNDITSVGSIDSTEYLLFSNASYGNPIDGLMDEVRVSTGARDACWLETEYNNQNSPPTFIYSIGSEVSNAPNAVILASFTAVEYDEGILLEWKTGYEASNLGFNIYREEGGRRIQINPELIKGSALMTGAETRTAGFAYAWWDKSSDQLSAVSGQQDTGRRSAVGGQYLAFSIQHSALSTIRYFLEDVDLSGAKTLHGPVTPVFSHKPAPKKAQSMLLSQINRQGAGGRAQGAGKRSQEPELRTKNLGEKIKAKNVNRYTLLGKTNNDSRITNNAALGAGARANVVVSSVDEGHGTLQAGQAYRIPSDRPNATPAARQRAIAAAPSVKIFIQEEGWYRVTQPQLVAAGLDPGVNPRLLQLFADGEEQPINVRGGSDDRFAPQDSVEFYGTGLDTPFTDTRVYWLAEGMRSGKRIPRIGEDAGDRVSSLSFPYTKQKKDRTIYLAALRNGDAPNFFGAVVSETPAEQILKVSHLAPSPPGNAELEVSLQGVSAGAHQVKITVNGVVVGTMDFQGQALKAERFPLVQSGLVEGDNTVTLVVEGLSSDVSLVDYIRLTYWRTYTAEEDALRFTANGGDFLRVNGFSGSSVRVMDITNPHRVIEVEGQVSANAEGYSIRFRVPGHGSRTLLAFVDEGAKNPAALAANQPSNWHQADRAVDLLIISYGLFLESLEPLKTWRESQGLSVAIVDVEDVYDEFSFGTKTPQSLKNFFLHSKSSWQNPPRFVLLVGDASFDPRNFYGAGSFDFMPTKLVDTYYQETASDDWFVDFDEDGLPDMAIGRLPVRTPEEAAAVIAKITGYEQSAGSMTDVLMVADMADEAGNFPASSRQVEALFPEGLTLTEVFRDEFPDDVQVRNALLSSLNQGPLVVNYMGHGTTQFWRGGIFGSDDAEALTNGLRLPFFIHMACLNGWFHDPFSEGLAEALLKAEAGGALAAWASSGLTMHAPQLVMNKELITLLFNGEGLTIGEAVKKAKEATTDADVRKTWVLFGDPATRLKP
jgi:hypothetical protein